MATSCIKNLAPSRPEGSEVLAQERAPSNVRVEKLSELLFTQDSLTRQDRILKIPQAEKVFHKSQDYNAGREARFITALVRQKGLQELIVAHGWVTVENG